MITYAIYQGTPISPYGDVNINSSMDLSDADIKKDSILVRASNFGLFPFSGLHEILSDANWIDNHRSKIIEDLSNTPKNFSGIFMIDYSEFWHAHFDWSDYESVNGYFYDDGFQEELACSDSVLGKLDSNYKEDFYNYLYINNKSSILSLYRQQQRLDDDSLDSFMRSQWNAVAKVFFEETISTVREYLPNAKLGFFNYPNSIYKSEYLVSQSPNTFGYGDLTGLGSTINNDLRWLYESIDLISPHIKSVRYTIDNSRTPQTGIENTKTQNQTYIKSNINEAKRIADMTGSYLSPILSHLYDMGRLSDNDRRIVNEINENQQVILANQLEADYSILFANIDSEEQKTEIEERFVSNVLGLSTQGFGFNSLGRLTPPASGTVRNKSNFIDPVLFDEIDIEGDLGEDNSPPPMGVDNRNVKVYPLWEDDYLSLSGNIRQFADWWKMSNGVDTLISKMDEDYADGFRRFMLYNPAGSITERFEHSPHQWFTMSEERRNEISSKLGAWISSHERVNVMVFMGLETVIDEDNLSSHEIDYDNSVIPDLSNAVDAEYFNSNISPWVDIGVTSFVFPGAFDDPSSFEDFAEANWENSIISIGIGFPVEDGEIVEDRLSNFPIAISMPDFIELQSDNDWVFSLNNTDIGIIISPTYNFSVNDINSLLDKNVIFYTTDGWHNNFLTSDEEEEGVVQPIFEIENGPGTDTIAGFGISRYDPGKSYAIGETDGESYRDSEVVCIANSIDGTFEINSELNKYTTVSVDILNPSFVNTSYPHYVIEDSFEWVNSGMPSHLSQVMHSNMATMGINITRTNPSDIEKVPPHQARYIVPCNKSFYDSFNSTIDYIEESNKGAREIFIPYTNAVVYIEILNSVWVGGTGGLISIDIDTKQINEVIIDSRRTVNVQDLYILDDYVYIVGQNAIYRYSLIDGSVIRDPALGVLTGIRCFVKTRNDTFIIGAEDGFYARKSTQDEYQKTVDTDNPVDKIIHPDATIAIAGKAVYYTTDGFSWDLIGVSSRELSDISKYRNKIMFATDEGLYDDNGNVYAARLSLRLNDVFNDLDESRDIIVNSVDSTVLKVLSGLKDGRYIVLDDLGFSIGSVDGIDAIHSVLIVDGENWIFGYDKFAITSEGVVRLLATGETMPNGGNSISQII